MGVAPLNSTYLFNVRVLLLKRILSEYILESKDRIIAYQSYVLKDMKSSARNLLIIIEKNIDE